MGKNGDLDLKITDFYNGMVMITEQQSNPEKGYLLESEMTTTKFVKKIEMTYHKDGSFLSKIKDGLTPIYDNPYGRGERWTPTADIEDFQPIINICIRRMAIYNTSFAILPTLKSKEIAYVCENDDLFESTGSYNIIMYIRNKNIPISRYTTYQGYSDILSELNSQYDLCLLIQRHSYPPAEPYYCEAFKTMITPYLCNSYDFCNKETSKIEMHKKLDQNIFDRGFSNYLAQMSDGNIVNLSEDKLQLIDEVDIFYKGKEGRMQISKPTFIKLALRYLGDKLQDFNTLLSSEKQNVFQCWNNELEEDYSHHTKNKE